MSLAARLRVWFGAGHGSRFRRNVVTVARANLVAQALPALAAPLLTRLYAPAEFGLVAIFGSVLGIGLAFATLRLEWSLPNARGVTAAAALLVLGSAALLTVTLAGGLVFGLAQAALPSAWQALGALWWLLPLALLGGGLQQLLQAWHVRGAELAVVGRAKVTASAAGLGVTLAAAWWGGAWGLVAGVVAGSWVGLATLWRRADGLTPALRRLDGGRLRALARRFGGEAGWSTLVSLANAASFAVVPLLLARHYGVAEVGWYALMQRVALAPVGVVSAAVSQGFWAEAARLVRDDRLALARLHARSSRRLLALAVPLALLALAGPHFVGPLFGGSQWAGAGAVLAAMAPMLVGQVVVSPISHLVVHRRQRWQALWDGLRLLALVAAIEAAAAAGAGFVGAVLSLSLVMAIMYGVLFTLNRLALRARR